MASLAQWARFLFNSEDPTGGGGTLLLVGVPGYISSMHFGVPRHYFKAISPQILKVFFLILCFLGTFFQAV